MRKIHIICPVCFKNKRVSISDKIFNIDEGSLLKLPFKKGEICSHQFIAIIDYNFSVRDYEIIKNDFDFQIYKKKIYEPIKSFDFSFF